MADVAPAVDEIKSTLATLHDQRKGALNQRHALVSALDRDIAVLDKRIDSYTNLLALAEADEPKTAAKKAAVKKD